MDMRIHLGKHSPIFVSCEDGPIQVRDMITPKQYHMLCFFFFHHTHHVDFSSLQSPLEYLDRYLDIPLIEAYFHRRDYSSWYRLLQNELPFPPWLQVPDLAQQAIRHGHINALLHLHHHYPHELTPHTNQMGRWAVEYNQLGSLQFIREHHYMWNGKELAQYAVKKGHVSICQYILQQQPTRIHKYIMPLCEMAIRQHDLPMFQLLSSSPNNTTYLPHHHYIPIAIRYGALPILQFISSPPLGWNEDMTTLAAKYDQLEVLQYLHEQQCPWNEQLFRKAKTLRIIKYAHEHGCPWNEEACSNASSLAILQYLHAHHCPWNAKTCSNAAFFGNLDMLIYAHEHGCPWNEDTCVDAANLQILMYAHEHGCPWSAKACRMFAYRDKLDMLDYARSHQCPFP